MPREGNTDISIHPTTQNGEKPPWVKKKKGRKKGERVRIELPILPDRMEPFLPMHRDFTPPGGRRGGKFQQGKTRGGPPTYQNQRGGGQGHFSSPHHGDRNSYTMSPYRKNRGNYPPQEAQMNY